MRGEEQVEFASAFCSELEEGSGGGVRRVRVESRVTEGVSPFAKKTEGALDHFFGGVSMANVNHLVAPPGAHGGRWHMRHEFGERLHGADGGSAEGECLFKATSDGVETHGRVELALDGVQFLDPAGEAFWPANREPHRGVVEVGVRVDEAREEGCFAHLANGSAGLEGRDAILFPMT